MCSASGGHVLEAYLTAVVLGSLWLAIDEVLND